MSLLNPFLHLTPLHSTPPFGEDRKCGLNLRAQITSANYNYQFYPQLFDTISSPTKELISRLLKVNPEERISAEEIMNHSWLQDSQFIRWATALMNT